MWISIIGAVIVIFILSIIIVHKIQYITKLEARKDAILAEGIIDMEYSNICAESRKKGAEVFYYMCAVAGVVGVLIGFYIDPF